MREYYDKMKSFPSPSKQSNRSESSESSITDNTKTESVKAGVCLDTPQKAKVKGANGQTKGLLWYRSIK
tara:strand:+ start:690 stop:896 length:207 start_codon:yes stop_codon:yes gene_type:complete